MKLRNRLKQYKRIAAAVVILIFVAGIELLANYHALKEGFDDLDLSASIQVKESNGSEIYSLSYKSKNGIYLKQIKLTGSFETQYSYSIITTEVNSFGKEEKKTYSDTVNPWFSEFYTNINQRVTSVEITLAKNAGEELTSVSFSNRVEINKYRIVFLVIVLSLFYCIFFEEMFLKKIEWFFVIYALAFGLLTIVYAQPERNSWDEQIHFRNAYRIASGKNVEWTESAYDLVNLISVNCNTKAEYAELRDYMNRAGREPIMTEVKETQMVSYGSLAYIPMALFLRLGMLLQLEFSSLYGFGKVGNLLVYIIIMFWAIRLAKSKKEFLLFLCMMPTVLFQASSYTYDSVVFSFITLGCVLWCNLAFYPEQEHYVAQMVGSIFFLTVGSFSKAVYIPILLLLLFLPAFGRKERKKRLVYSMLLLGILALVMMTFVLPTLTNTVTGNLSYGGDARGGDTGSVRQLISMAKHPLESIKLMVENVFAFDNFRNLGTAAADNHLFINLMFLNFSSLGILSEKWSVILLPIAVLLLFYNGHETGEKKKKKYYQWIMILIITMVVGLIWLALYLSFTPVGDEVIAGVQARYYLPLIYLLALTEIHHKIEVKMDRAVAIRLALVSALLLEAVAVYEIMLSTRLF